MEVKTKKETTVNRSTRWTRIIYDDYFEQVATMTGLINAGHPAGATSLTVDDRGLYAANMAGCKELYAAFQAEVAEAVEGFEPTETVTEGDDISTAVDDIESI